MSDQNIITDWKAYFEALGPGTPSPLSRDRQPLFDGPLACHVVLSQKDALSSHDCPDDASFLDWARDLWEAEGRPELWAFINRSGPPWHVPAQPAAKPQNRKK